MVNEATMGRSEVNVLREIYGAWVKEKLVEINA